MDTEVEGTSAPAGQPKIAQIDTVDSLDAAGELLELVDQIQVTPPYSYAPGEIPASRDWFPRLAERADLTLIAFDGAAPIGYCVALTWNGYGRLLDYADRLGIDPATTMYVAELGVAPAARRRGIASALLTRAHQAYPAGTTASVVRTLAGNQPAIQLYERHGYRHVEGLEQNLHGRARIFLLSEPARRTSAAAGRSIG
jgi:ribosomal protein S18 acetylase RimI-like enzyme